jgi:hypothetical protein
MMQIGGASANGGTQVDTADDRNVLPTAVFWPYLD